MIDKEKIRQAIDSGSCNDIGLSCFHCPVYAFNSQWFCGKKIANSQERGITHGIRPRAIRIMKEWLEEKPNETDN